MIKESEAHEARSHWTLMKNSEANNKHKNKYGKIKNILSIWYFERNIFPCGRLIKHKYKLCAHRLMQQWEVNYLENYAPVVNWISVSSLLDIASIHEFPIISIDFVIFFTQNDLDVNFFMGLPLLMGVDVKIVEWFLDLNKSLYGLKQASANWFGFLKLV